MGEWFRGGRGFLGWVGMGVGGGFGAMGKWWNSYIKIK